MSEYQYYEFQAIDRPLTREEMSELRALSTRATITPTRFTNVYNWGDFKGDPRRLMEDYFDAFVYITNWGTREFMVRLPLSLLDLKIAELYCDGEDASAWVKKDHIILDFVLQDEEGDGWIDDEEGETWLSSLIPLRSEIANGDLRSLYLAWLSHAQSAFYYFEYDEEYDHEGGDGNDEDVLEPPVPPGLKNLTASQKALVDFLEIDEDLITVAAEQSPDLIMPSQDSFEQWVLSLTDSEKSELLLRFVKGDNPHLRADLLQRFLETNKTKELVQDSSRSMAKVITAAKERRIFREREEEQRKAEEKARREREQAVARAKYLDGLSEHQEETWQKIESLIETKQAIPYELAVKLLMDLRDVGARTNGIGIFHTRLNQLRERHARKSAFIRRLEEARL